MHTTDSTETERQQLYRDMDPLHLRPLWEVLHALVPPAPRPSCAPMLWRYDAEVRRITDLHNAVGDRFALFTGVDNLLLESAILGIDGWVAGTGIAFPRENQRLWELTRAGKWEAARALYRWFTPLLHLDVHPKFVQYIKLATQEVGLGKEWVRAPRRPLEGDERKRILKVIRTGIAHRPKLRD